MMTLPNFDIEKFKALLKERDMELVQIGEIEDRIIEIEVKRKSSGIKTGFTKEFAEDGYVSELGTIMELERSLDEFDINNVLKNWFKNSPDFIDQKLNNAIKRARKEIAVEKGEPSWLKN